MTIETLTSMLTETLGESIPVFFHHVFITEGEELPPVYVVTAQTGVNPFRADNKNYYMSYLNTVTVCTATFDETILVQVEGILNNAGVPFERSTEFDDDTLLYLTVYEVNLDS